jgi:hypothetical protein
MGSGYTACGKSEAVPSEVPAMCTPHRLCLALILCLLAFVCAHAADTQTGGVPDLANKAPGNKAPLAPPAQTPAPGSSDTSDTRAGLAQYFATWFRNPSMEYGAAVFPVATERLPLKAWLGITGKSKLIRRAEPFFALRWTQTLKGSRLYTDPTS